MKNNIKIGFIGAGRVGTAFGKYLKINGFNITGYYSRTYVNCSGTAEYIGCAAYTELKSLIEDCEVIFLTVNDDNISFICSEIANSLNDLSGKVFCHSSGVYTSEILDKLKSLGAEVCSIHMLLAVNDKFESYKYFNEAFFTIEGNCEKLCKVLDRCGNDYQIILPENKAKYHAAAVFASNFVVALSDIACSMLAECGFSYNEALKALSPLMKNNIKNIVNFGPKKSLTGPVRRSDFETVRKHLLCFGDNNSDRIAKDVYRILTQALLFQTNQKETIEEIEEGEKYVK